MATKHFCDFCGEEIIKYKNNITDENIKFDSKIMPGYNSQVKLSIQICASKEAFGTKTKKDICKNCVKSLIKQL